MALDVGRTTRIVPPRLRLALNHRDRGCRYPGCSLPALRTEAHHLQHWALGGVTSLENLVSLCRFHHRRHHLGAFDVSRAGPNEFRFTDKNGAEIKARRLTVDRQTGGAAHLRSTARSRGTPITAYTPVARDGAPIDLAWATSVIADGCTYLQAHRHHPGLLASPR